MRPCLQAVLSQLERPLLCTSAHVEEQDQLEIPEAAMFVDLYAGQGLDFVVDSGQRVRPAVQLATMCLLLGSVVSHFGCFLSVKSAGFWRLAYVSVCCR